MALYSIIRVYQVPAMEGYRLEIERRVLAIIEEQLLSGRMDARCAKEIAQRMLDTFHPQMTRADIYRAVLLLGERFPELASVVSDVKDDHNEQVKTQVTQEVDKLIEDGNIEEATELVKIAIHNVEDSTIGQGVIYDH